VRLVIEKRQGLFTGTGRHDEASLLQWVQFTLGPNSFVTIGARDQCWLPNEHGDLVRNVQIQDPSPQSNVMAATVYRRCNTVLKFNITKEKWNIDIVLQSSLITYLLTYLLTELSPS
jgi:hypothetical protein